MTNLVSKKSLAMAIALFAVVAVTAAYAQTGISRVDVPFQFRAGGQLLPAGKYVVESNDANRRILLRSEDGRTAMWIAAQRAYRGSADDPGMLLFNKYGNNYFLSQVWNYGSSSGLALSPSRAEREMARANAAHEVASLQAVSR